MAEKKKRTGNKGSSSGKSRDAGRKRSVSQRAQLQKLRAQQAQQRENTLSWLKPRVFPMWARMFAVVAAVLLLLLVFFRVDDFQVSGNVRYSAAEIADASGVTQGDVLMGVNKTRCASRILSKLPYVKQVTIAKELPGTVRFNVSESRAIAAAESESGALWLINEDGKLLERVEDDGSLTLPRIQGTYLDLPIPGDPASFLASDQGLLGIETAQAIYRQGIQTRITVIDVSDPENLTLVLEGRLDVQLGIPENLDYKLLYMVGAADQLDSAARGMLDVSFSQEERAVYHPVA